MTQPTQPTILVTGATGKVGGAVVAQLHAAGVPVRALVRGKAPDFPDGVQAVRGDLADPASLGTALEGVDAVFLVWPFLSAEGASDVIDAIGKHARRVVYLSSAGVADQAEEPGEAITLFHTELERLVEASGLEWTALRPTGFAGNTLGWAEEVRTTGAVRAPLARLARPLIHEADMAAVAVQALTTDALLGARPLITGPELVTQERQVALIGEAIGRPLRFEEITLDEAAEEMKAAGYPAELVEAIVPAQAQMLADPEPVNDEVERITGTPARSFREWAADHAADFR
ncbi:nucleotide-diphosphate-sugar epimerase [Streptomyces spiroverticillatus]|uniref:Nucleotide-diphosphate-sugar epimerase n=1 Tax=Streptomyces finlayi TaxID=67296 RepID=A0A919C638_9ACTN|nr:NAD(P)H-binding protein [Streptomyces finlayi]GGZ84936.1 nucleotide-diphosphate-sugar epimerase [Streptomyces spiroverticillatus]GHC76669.1 nucleotide-diphosphate-sugar epimerase [Streptomyces finlayi]